MGGRCFARRKFAISGRFCPASQWLGARWSLLECFATCHSRVLPQTGPTTQMWRIFNLNGRSEPATSSLALHPRFVSTWLDRDISKSDRVLRAALWCLNTLEEKIERCLLQRVVLCERKKRVLFLSRAVPGRFCRKKLTRVCGAVVALFTRHPRPHYWHIKLTDMPIILFYTDHRHRPTSFFDVNESIINHFWNTCSFGCFCQWKMIAQGWSLKTIEQIESSQSWSISSSSSSSWFCLFLILITGILSGQGWLCQTSREELIDARTSLSQSAFMKRNIRFSGMKMRMMMISII